VVADVVHVHLVADTQRIPADSQHGGTPFNGSGEASSLHKATAARRLTQTRRPFQGGSRHPNGVRGRIVRAVTAPTDRQRTRWIAVAVALLVVGIAVGWIARGAGAGTTSSSPASSTVAGATVAGATVDVTTVDVTTAPVDSADPNCPAIRAAATIGVDELPSQAVDTLGLVADGGPFPFEQDGGVFQNRERLLPLQATGYYHEYTVITPGSPDRGARRIIVGECGDRWYTDDHYDSFRLVIDA